MLLQRVNNYIPSAETNRKYCHVGVIRVLRRLISLLLHAYWVRCDQRISVYRYAASDCMTVIV